MVPYTFFSSSHYNIVFTDIKVSADDTLNIPVFYALSSGVGPMVQSFLSIQITFIQ